MSRLLVTGLVLFAVSLPSVTRAQITNVTSDQASPTPGVGHNYIGAFSEIVNPANGSLSIRLDVPMPGGRGIALPFHFSYNSSGVFQFQDINFNLSVKGGADQGFMEHAGWSYSVPTFNSGIVSIPSQNPTYPNASCPVNTEFVFTDEDGSRHSLPLAIANQSQCSQLEVYPSVYYSANDGVYAAWTQNGAQDAYLVPFSVQDKSGTVYHFAQLGNATGTGNLSWTCLEACSIPDFIEDRNGNKITFSAGIYGIPLTETDTASRSALSISAFGSAADLITMSALTNPYTVDWGTNATYNFTFTANPVFFNDTGCGALTNTQASGSFTSVTSIKIPNNEQYTFYYDSTYGLLKEIVYPTGGYVKYTWGISDLADTTYWADGTRNPGACAAQYSSPVILHRYVSFDGSTTALQQDFAYTTNWNPSNPSLWLSKQTIVTTTDFKQPSNPSFQTTYTYSPAQILTPPDINLALNTYEATQVPQEQTIVYKDWNGSTLQTVSKSWSSLYTLGSQQTTLGGQTNEVAYSYQGLSVMSEKDEYDFGSSGSPGPLLRKTVLSFSAPVANPLGAKIWDRPSSVVVYDGSSNRISETDYSYDTTATSSATATNHDETNFGTTFLAPRGNATSETKQCFPSCTNAATTYTYYETGQTITMTDPNLNVTKYSYADSYTSGTPPSNTNAYVTQIKRPTATNGVSHISNYSYGYLDGQLTVAKDENSQSTSYVYETAGLDRLKMASYPDSGQTTYSYNDAPPSPTVTTSTLITSGLSLTTITTFDGMGHQVGTALTTDPQGTDYTATTYDGLGSIYTASNPYRSTSDTTYGTTTTVYDALNRTTLVTKPDGSSSTVSTVYTGNCATVTDEAGKTRESCVDGLGRMTAVIENPGGLGWVTNYTYDALDDLTTVLQGGSRKRSFVYDSLKRLTSSANPETGGTNHPVLYTYDANGNVVTKTDARAITITYSWDALNRLSKRTYSNSDPYAGFGYDSATCVVVSSCYNIGHMTSMTDAAGTESRAYDQMGRLWGDQRTTNSVPKNASYVYYLDGSLKTLNYPSGHSVAYTPGGAGLPLSAADSALTSSAYAASGQYTAWGARNSTTFGGYIGENILFNKRLQPCWTFVSSVAGISTTSCTGSETSSGNLMDVQYNFNVGADNGNLVGITNNRNSNRSQSYSYDALNRITGAATLSACTANCWHLAFGIDEWANLTGVSGTENAIFSPNANNQIGAAGFTYDLSGNELTDVTSTYAWNAESQMKTGGGVTYLYDGQGNRVEKSGTKLYWYGQNGQVLDETDTTGSTANAVFTEYIYFAGARVARRDYLNNVYYYFEDQVNSSRAIAEIPAGSTTPTLCYDADFYPYGGEIDFTSTCAQNYKFQGKERDTETTNDYFGARYYSSAYGRFLSPDWSSVPSPVPYADPTDPETLNLYGFVRDNPVSKADKDGHCPWCIAVVAAEVIGWIAGDIYFDQQKKDSAKIAYDQDTALLQIYTLHPTDPALMNIDIDELGKSINRDWLNYAGANIKIGSNILALIESAESMASRKPGKVLQDAVTDQAKDRAKEGAIHELYEKDDAHRCIGCEPPHKEPSAQDQKKAPPLQRPDCDPRTGCAE